MKQTVSGIGDEIEVRRYTGFRVPIDPAVILGNPDMDLSYALASTLVTWDAAKQVTSSLASQWIVDGQSVEFILRPTGRWSNGELVSAEDVKTSMESTFQRIPQESRSLSNMIASIEVVNPARLRFTLHPHVPIQDFLKKLTEPNFGIIRVVDGMADTSLSTGPYFTESATKDEVLLRVNEYWFSYRADMAKRIALRQSPKGMAQERQLLDDSWCNLMETSSMLSAELLKTYVDGGYSIWRRSVDRIFLTIPRSNESEAAHFALVRALSLKLKRETLTAGLTGITITDQLFPRTYALHDAEFVARPSATAVVPEEFTKRPIRLIAASGFFSDLLRRNVIAAITEATGIEPELRVLTGKEFYDTFASKDFDLYIGAAGLDDPHSDGVMSFYFEGENPPVPQGREKFVERLDAARKLTTEAERLAAMRSIVSDATNGGHILPLFHFSTIGIGRPGIDLSKVPDSDESVTFSKIRIKR